MPTKTDTRKYHAESRPRPGSRVCKDLMEGLEALVQSLDEGEPLEKRFTVHTVTIPEPASYSASAVKRVRRKLGVSQALFAQIMGTSKKLIEAWETGTRTPSLMACRLLDAIHRDPAAFFRRMEKKAG